jgi:N-acetylneuraminate synthase
VGINFLKKKIIECCKNKTKIIILGRGFSTSFFLKNVARVKNKNLIIGFNTNEIVNQIDFYFTNKKQIPNNLPKRKLVELKKLIDLNKSEVKIFKIGSIKYSLDPFLFFLNKTAEKIKKSLEIVFVGFDFRTSSPEGDYKRKIRKNLIQSHIDISGQRDLFFKRKKFYSNLNILHAGFDLYSDIDPRENIFTKIKEKKKFKVKIVAEITTNHHGDTKKIIDLIYGAKKAGADFVKFQMRDVENFYTKKILAKDYKSPYGKTFREYRNKLELTNEQIELIIKFCKKLKIEPFFSVLDIVSFKKLKKYNLRLLKIPSTISEDKVFLNFVKNNYKGEIVISTGMTNKNYLLKCAKLFKNNKKLYLLHCVSSYPTSPLDGNLSVISTIKNLSSVFKNIVPGYSSHDLTKTGAAMAVALGAQMIEKHIKVGSNKWAHFDETALDVNYEFPSWVQYVRSSENMLGNKIKKILKSEHHKYPLKN